MLDKFASLYPVTKTLRFRLLPQGRTEENMQAAKVLENDLERSEAAAVVKGLIKKYCFNIKHYISYIKYKILN